MLGMVDGKRREAEGVLARFGKPRYLGFTAKAFPPGVVGDRTLILDERVDLQGATVWYRVLEDGQVPFMVEVRG